MAKEVPDVVNAVQDHGRPAHPNFQTPGEASTTINQTELLHRHLASMIGTI